MVTLKGFVGAVLHSLTTGRIQGDQASLACAKHYLEDEYLRGFPVPRMTLQNVELEFSFGVVPITPLEASLQQPELRENIVHRLSDALARLPDAPGVKEAFDADTSFRKAWADGQAALPETVEKILSSKVQDRTSLTHRLALAIENSIFAAHCANPNTGFLQRIGEFLAGGSSSQTPDADAIRTWVLEQVGQVLDAALPAAEDSNDAESPDVNILVGAQDLQGIDPKQLATTKLTFSHADRKWVATQINGKKVYTLDR